jgi:hypothetical protein
MTPFLSTSVLANAADEYELDGDDERAFQQDIPRRPNGVSRHHSSASQRILRDLETPIESVLWDEDEDAVENATSSSSAAPFKGAGSETTMSDGESDRGDISVNVNRTKLVEAGSARLA